MQDSDSGGLEQALSTAEPRKRVPGGPVIIRGPGDLSRVLQCETSRFQKKIVTLMGPNM